MNEGSGRRKLLTKHVAMCLISVGHGDGLILTVVYFRVGVVRRLNFEGVDIRNVARVSKIGVVIHLVKELRELGDVYEIDLWGRVCLVSIEIITQTLRCRSKTGEPGCGRLCCDNSSGAVDLLGKSCFRTYLV